MAWAEISARGWRFPYREEGNPPLLRPTVDVSLSHEGLTWGCRALVDTGAPISFFDRAMADALAVHIDTELTPTITVLGGTWAVQTAFVDFEITGIPDLSWTARVAFVKSQEFKMPFQGVLGTEGFLDRHVVTFNKYMDYFTVEDAGVGITPTERYPSAAPANEGRPDPLLDDGDWWRPTLD